MGDLTSFPFSSLLKEMGVTHLGEREEPKVNHGVLAEILAVWGSRKVSRGKAGRGRGLRGEADGEFCSGCVKFEVLYKI